MTAYLRFYDKVYLNKDIQKKKTLSGASKFGWLELGL